MIRLGKIAIDLINKLLDTQINVIGSLLDRNQRLSQQIVDISMSMTRINRDLLSIHSEASGEGDCCKDKGGEEDFKRRMDTGNGASLNEDMMKQVFRNAFETTQGILKQRFEPDKDKTEREARERMSQIQQEIRRREEEAAKTLEQKQEEWNKYKQQQQSQYNPEQIQDSFLEDKSPQ